MASGNRSTSQSSHAPAIIYVKIPHELKYLVSLYQVDRRMISFREALQRLLETHPDLTALANGLYTGTDSTSPPTE